MLGAIAIERGILNVLLFMIIGVAGFGILAIFSMIVVEKTRDIGILKSLGASNGGIINIFLGYGLLLGTVGAGLGTVLGLLDHLLHQRNRSEAGAAHRPADFRPQRFITSTRYRRTCSPSTWPSSSSGRWSSRSRSACCRRCGRRGCSPCRRCGLNKRFASQIPQIKKHAFMNLRNLRINDLSGYYGESHACRQRPAQDLPPAR